MTCAKRMLEAAGWPALLRARTWQQQQQHAEQPFQLHRAHWIKSMECLTAGVVWLLMLLLLLVALHALPVSHNQHVLHALPFLVWCMLCMLSKFFRRAEYACYDW